MNIPEIFIRRPIATILVMLGILLFGVAGYRALPVSDLPNVDFPTIQVQANLPGANPDTMAAAVALPLEKAFSAIAGLDSMASQNTLGRTSIVLQFTLARNIDGAALDVQAAISQAARQLPLNMPAPPSFSKVNPADTPVLNIALFGHGASFHGRRVRRNLGGADGLDGQRRGPGGRVWSDKICRSRAIGSQSAGDSTNRHRRRRERPQ